MPRIDELDNEKLSESLDGFGYGDLTDELERVEDLIEDHTLTGVDLAYWITRSEMVLQEKSTREV